MRARTMLSISLCSIPNWLDDGMVTSALSSGGPNTPDEEAPPESGTASVMRRVGRALISRWRDTTGREIRGHQM